MGRSPPPLSTTVSLELIWGTWGANLEKGSYLRDWEGAGPEILHPSTLHPGHLSSTHFTKSSWQGQAFPISPPANLSFPC